MKEEKIMEDKQKCNRYEALFTFRSEEELQNHINECPDCKKEHEIQKKISNLVKEVAPIYLEKQQKKKISNIKRLACCFVLFIGISAFTGYKIYDDNYFINSSDDSCVSAMGLPTDEYGFLEL